MKKFRALSLWCVGAVKGTHVPAPSARWFAGNTHSVLGKFTQGQCERMQTRIWNMMRR